MTVLALGSMGSFLSLGCGGGSAQHDAGQHDAGQQDVAQEDAAQHDAAQHDANQADAANTSGNIVIVNAQPQLTGVPAYDAMLGGLQVSYVLAGWDAVENDPDVPTSVLDLRNGSPFGCYAKYYKKGQVLDSGLTSNYLPTTANAGDITVSGYTKGAFFLGLDDGGTPITTTFPDTINCKFSAIEDKNDAGTIPDAATGRYEYNCDNELGGQTVPVTAFLAPGTDNLHVTASGTTEIGGFDATSVPVAPFIKALPTGSLWALPTVAAATGTDAGVPINYACGSTDAGPDTAGCSQALAIQISWGDVDTEMTDLAAMANPPWSQERGKIQCAKVGAGNQFFIPWQIWNASGLNNGTWRTISTFITHISVVPEHGLSTVVGAGGGAVGVTHHP